MGPFCIKIAKIFLGEDPQTPPPFNHNFFLHIIILYIHIDNQMKFSHAAASIDIYTVMRGGLQKYKKNHIWKPNILNQHSEPHPPRWFMFLLFIYLFIYLFCGWK